MAQIRRDSKFLEPYLVAEQPGARVLLFGLLIAFLFSLAIRTYFSISNVKQLVSVAAERIHPSFRLYFDGIKMSFVQDSLPGIVVSISGITGQLRDSCAGNMVVSVDEVRLPIDLQSILFGELRIKNIFINKVDLDLNLIKNHLCFFRSPETATSIRSGVHFHQLRNNEDGDKSSIENVYITEMTLRYLSTFKFKNLNFQIKNQSPLNVEVEGIYSEGIAISSDFNQFFDFSMQVDLRKGIEGEFNSTVQSGKLFGNFKYLFAEKSIEGNGSFEQLPVGYISQLLLQLGFNLPLKNETKQWAQGNWGYLQGINNNGTHEETFFLKNIQSDGRWGIAELKNIILNLVSKKVIESSELKIPKISGSLLANIIPNYSGSVGSQNESLNLLLFPKENFGRFSLNLTQFDFLGWSVQSNQELSGRIELLEGDFYRLYIDKIVGELIESAQLLNIYGRVPWKYDDSIANSFKIESAAKAQLRFKIDKQEKSWAKMNLNFNGQIVNQKLSWKRFKASTGRIKGKNFSFNDFQVYQNLNMYEIAIKDLTLESELIPNSLWTWDTSQFTYPYIKLVVEPNNSNAWSWSLPLVNDRSRKFQLFSEGSWEHEKGYKGQLNFAGKKLKLTGLKKIEVQLE
jgi:hypothetical protein